MMQLNQDLLILVFDLFDFIELTQLKRVSQSWIKLIDYHVNHNWIEIEQPDSKMNDFETGQPTKNMIDFTLKIVNISGRWNSERHNNAQVHILCDKRIKLRQLIPFCRDLMWNGNAGMLWTYGTLTFCDQPWPFDFYDPINPSVIKYDQFESVESFDGKGQKIVYVNHLDRLVEDELTFFDHRLPLLKNSLIVHKFDSSNVNKDGAFIILLNKKFDQSLINI